MYTYNLKVRERTVQIKMLKAHAEAVNRQIRQALQVAQYHRELTGTIGGEEHSCTVMALFGPGDAPIANPEKYAADVAAFVAGLPDLITAENVRPVLEQAAAIYNEHLPIVDNRKTPEQEQEHKREFAERQAESSARHEAARAAWVEKYCDSAEGIHVPAGMMPVILEANYDDSDPMTDYYHEHHGHGFEMLLGFVPAKTRKTEILHREIMRRYPDLAALSWTWHVEDYSMGHGHWLQSENIGTAEGVRTYGGYNDPPIWWEISFGYCRGNDAILPYKGYGATLRPAASTGGVDPAGESGVGFTLTYERDWSWVSFPSKPADSVLEKLRAAGGHWGKRRGAWYFSRHVTAAEIGLTEEGEAQASPLPSPEAVIESYIDQHPQEFHTVEQVATARRLRTLADNMQADIDGKLNSAIGNQNYTARRAAIAEHMRHEGYFLEKVQAALRALAEAHEAGTVPATLQNVTTRKAVTDLLYAKDAALLELMQGQTPDRAEEENRRKQENEARRLVGIIPGYFPTPDPVIDRMLELAPVGAEDTCLEPEAGAGNIARRLTEAGAVVDTIEASTALCDILRARGFSPRCDDFLEIQPNGKRYTRIVMNPPFEKGQDMEHILHAYEFLAEGGRLVSVATPGVTWRSDLKHAEFRQWLEDVGGSTYDLPADSFKESGTNVAALLVVVDK